MMVVNYNTRLLGRRGVMTVSLVVDPNQVAATVPAFNDLLKSYSFNSGQGYAEFRAGDKIAKYGLTALVAGGAGAVAAKNRFAQMVVEIHRRWSHCIARLPSSGISCRGFWAGGLLLRAKAETRLVA